MDKILHQLIVYPIIYMVLYIPGGDRRISEPSTVSLVCFNQHLGLFGKGSHPPRRCFFTAGTFQVALVIVVRWPAKVGSKSIINMYDNTPWKINMDHNHGGLDDHVPFYINGWFVGSMLIFQGVYHIVSSWNSKTNRPFQGTFAFFGFQW